MLIVCLWGYVAAKVCAANMHPLWIVALSLTAWVVYTADNLLDGLKNTALTMPRHSFHARYKHLLTASASVIALMVAVLSYLYLTPKVFYFGMVLATLSAAYFYLIHNHHILRKIPLKELSAAIVFSLGIWYGPLLKGDYNGNLVALAIVYYTLSVFFNLIYLALCEYEYDRENSFYSLVLLWGKQRSLFLLKTIVAGKALLLAGFMLLIQPEVYTYLFVALMLILLTVEIYLLMQREHLANTKKYRIWADGVFFSAIIFPVYDIVLYSLI